MKIIFGPSIIEMSKFTLLNEIKRERGGGRERDWFSDTFRKIHRLVTRLIFTIDAICSKGRRDYRRR